MADGGDPAGPGEEAPTGDPPPESRSGTERVWLCDVCGAPMLELHCKLICERCGYRRDCSDP